MLLCYCLYAVFESHYHVPTFFFLILPPPPRSTLFPYTTLFRSRRPDPWEVARTNETVEIQLNCSFEVRGGSLSAVPGDRKSTRLNSSHITISYAVFCLKKKNVQNL